MASSSTLASGTRNVVCDEEWPGRCNHGATSGGPDVYAFGLPELVRGKLAILLTHLEKTTELDPDSTTIVTNDRPQFRSTRFRIKALFRRKPPLASEKRTYLGHKGVLRNAPNRLHPAAKALRQPRPRLSIANGIGLSKTNEVGNLTSNPNQLEEWERRQRGQIAGERCDYEKQLRALAAQIMKRLEQEHQFIEVTAAMGNPGCRKV